MKRTPLLALERATQTVTGFANGPRVLADIARRTPVLQVRTKTGLDVRCPNVAGARVPLYELFVVDSYDMDNLLAGLPEDLVVLDIGGHIGCFSMALATARPRATVHTYEASPDTASFLMDNVARNRLGARVHPNATAVSDHTGTLEFPAGQFASGLNGISNANVTGTISVPCVTFAEAVSNAGGKVDLVKIDTEGAEYPIVLGSKPADWSSVQRVVAEFHRVPGHEWTELRDFFAEAGLHVTRSEFGSAGYGMLWLDRAAA